jgi:hypothetical protein
MLVCLIHIVPIAVVNSYYYTNPTKPLCQCYQSHLHTLSSLGKNNFSIVSSLNDLYRQYQSGIVSIIFVCLMVSNATFNNISVLLVDETGGPG